MSIGAYQTAVRDALSLAGGDGIRVTFVDSWHAHPRFLELMARRVDAALSAWPGTSRSRVVTLFSAHSLPERIRDWNDPYERQLLESCHGVARAAGIDNWRFAWQSAGETGEPWLGPDICEVLDSLYHDGVRDVLSVPIGFVSDHLEIFYDIDHEARARAEELGLTLRRTPMPNADADFARLLAAIATEAVAPMADRACAS
jgi:ferrochelatase